MIVSHEKDILDELEITGFSFSRYYAEEKEKIKPKLEGLGYDSVEFWTIEGDSFGPLVRGVRAKKDGQIHQWSYG